MIRLVTQFDPPHTRASAATPTCSCSSCSCCSCCVGTAVASTVFTAASVYHRGKEEEEVESARRWGAVALGLVALPAAVGLGIVALQSFGASGALVFYLVWLVLVAAAYRLVRAEAWLGRTLGVIAIATAFGFLEFLVGVGVEASTGYFVVELIAAAIAIWVGWKVAKEY